MGPLLLANKYLLLKRIAAGGMAEIFLAKQLGLDGFEKLVVVKRILPEFASAPEYVRMFLDEGKTAADLRHANIVSTIEIDEDKGIYFMVMEYLHGLDLRFVFRKLSSHKEAIPLPLCVGIVMEACAGLQYAHNKCDLKGRSLGIVHRDISPQNLVLTFDGEVKIVDFGIAQAAHLKPEAKEGVLKGKYAYMSPEQARSNPLDHRTDQFALGIVLYELTTMHRLFRRAHHQEALAAVSNCEVAPPSKLVPSYPPALEAIVMRALSLERDDRFADCGAFRSALGAFLHDAGLAYSRDALSNFLHQHLREFEDQRLDYAVSGIDPEHLNTTYLRPQTQSTSDSASAKKKKVAARRLLSPRRIALSAVLLLVMVLVPLLWQQPLSGAQKRPAAVKVQIAEDFGQSVGGPLTEAAEVPPPQVQKKYGRLKIVLEPWGEVFVDGKRIGLTPLAPQKLAEGNHMVRVVNTRFQKEKTLNVKIEANQDTLLRYQFE